MSAPHGMETRTRKALVTLIVLALLAVVLQSIVFSGASFTASKTNTANAFIAGTFGHVNNKDGQLVIDAVRLRPGQSLTGTFTVTGTGDVAGAYTLSKGAVVDTPASPGLSTALTLLVEDITTLPAQVLAPRRRWRPSAASAWARSRAAPRAPIASRSRIRWAPPTRSSRATA